MDLRDAAHAATLAGLCGALAITASGLVCAAAHAGVLPCSGFCAARTWPEGARCTVPPAEVQYEQELYFAIVDTVYHPQRFASIRDGSGLFLLQTQAVSGSHYLREPAVLGALTAAVRPESADSLVQSFSTANNGSHSFGDLWRLHRRELDSSTVERILNARDADLARESVISDLLIGLPADSLPGILTLSRAGVTPSGDVALVFATLRERRSREPDHLEAAAFLLARRDGARWVVMREIPVPRPRDR